MSPVPPPKPSLPIHSLPPCPPLQMDKLRRMSPDPSPPSPSPPPQMDKLRRMSPDLATRTLAALQLLDDDLALTLLMALQQEQQQTEQELLQLGGSQEDGEEEQEAEESGDRKHGRRHQNAVQSRRHKQGVLAGCPAGPSGLGISAAAGGTAQPAPPHSEDVQSALGCLKQLAEAGREAAAAGGSAVPMRRPSSGGGGDGGGGGGVSGEDEEEDTQTEQSLGDEAVAGGAAPRSMSGSRSVPGSSVGVRSAAGRRATSLPPMPLEQQQLPVGAMGQGVAAGGFLDAPFGSDSGRPEAASLAALQVLLQNQGAIPLVPPFWGGDHAWAGGGADGVNGAGIGIGMDWVQQQQQQQQASLPEPSCSGSGATTTEEEEVEEDVRQKGRGAKRGGWVGGNTHRLL